MIGTNVLKVTAADENQHLVVSRCAHCGAAGRRYAVFGVASWPWARPTGERVYVSFRWAGASAVVFSVSSFDGPATCPAGFIFCLIRALIGSSPHVHERN